MHATIERGRRITLGIAIWLTVVPLVLRIALLLFSRRPVPAGAWSSAIFSGAISLALGWLLYQGYAWTRLLFVVGLAVIAVVPTARMLMIARDFTTAGQWIAAAAIVIPRDTINLVLALVLWRSPSVVAFFERRNAIAT